MISTGEAKDIIIKALKAKELVKTVPVEQATGKVTAEDIFAPLDLPSFNNSAVDGYAFAMVEENPLVRNIIGEVKAGDKADKVYLLTDSMRIFTGAPIPEGTNTVIMQEHVKVEDNVLTLLQTVALGANIRLKGSQIEKGQLACRKGSVITPAAIGFLASLGLTEIPVQSDLHASIVVTGNELVDPGEELKEGMIYESNSSMLKAVLQLAGIDSVTIYKATDALDSLLPIIKKAFHNSDLLLVTGGISVGKYDLVKECLEEVGVSQLFYKVAQKPGKPLFFGIKANTPVFGLPGNPGAVLTCFYEYVYPAIKKISGAANCFLPELRMPLLEKVEKKPGLANFLKAKVFKEGVLPLSGQESFILKSFAEADGLIYLKPDTIIKEKGEMVDVHLFPFS